MRFSDGVESEADLLHLMRSRIFKAWGDKVDLNPDTLYTYVTGNTWKELYPTKMSEVVFVNAEARCGQTVWVRFDTAQKAKSTFLPISQRVLGH